MYFFRRPPPSPVASEALPPGLAGVVSARVPDAPKPVLPTLAQHGNQAWDKALSYAHDFARRSSDPEFAATLILRVARDFEVVRIKDRREVPVRHPAFGAQAVYLNERGKPIPFEKVMSQALTRSEFDQLSLYPEGGELVAKTPSGRWQACVAEIIPRPWYGVLVALGKGAKSGHRLDHYSYHAKVHLLGVGDPLEDDMPSRMMTQRHRLKSDEIRFFKGKPELWQQL